MPAINNENDLRERKRQAVLAAIENPAGVTNRELRDTHGFPSIAIKFWLDKLDIPYRVELDSRGEKRFFRH
jgi:predicted transcriptional regulator